MKSTYFLTGVALTMLYSAVANAEDFEPRLERGTSGPFAVDTKVNDGFITQGQIDLFMESLVGEEGKEVTGQEKVERRRAARKELVTQEALAQAAAARGMDKDVEVIDALSYSRREILARVFVEEFYRSNPVTEDQIKVAYELNRKEGKIFEYKVRQILLPTKEQAEGVLARLKRGEKFVDLTKLTRDPGANANGGYVSKTGWFRPDIFVDNTFAEAVENQPLNVPSATPFRTRYGWHVILVEEKRKVEKPEPYDQLNPAAKEALQQKIALRKLNELIQSVAHKAKLTNAKGDPLEFDKLD